MVSTAAAAEEAQLIQKIYDLLGKVDRKTTELIDTINRTVRQLPGFLAGLIIKRTNEFLAVLQRAYDALADVLGNMGSPSALWDCADAWSDKVGGPVSGLASNSDLNHVRADDSWTGDAADAYKNTLGPQKNALAAVKTALTDGIATALTETAKAIIVFWAALAIGLAALVAGIISALASSATVVGLPAGPFIAAGAALAFVACCVGGGMNLTSATADQNTKLRQKLNDNVNFPDEGHWPRSTADMSDGSMSDGTPGGWHLKGA
jgi:hypothetical protein